MIQENLTRDRCVVRFLGSPPPPKRQQQAGGGSSSSAAADEETAAALTKEVDPSTLVKFPGGQRLMVLTERMPPLGQRASKEEKDAQVAEEFLMPANEEKRVRFRTRTKGKKRKRPTRRASSLWSLLLPL